MMDLNDCFDKVSDEASFLEFAKALHLDNKNKKNRREWENNTIAGFLESATAYFEDTDFMEKQAGKNPWKKFALFSLVPTILVGIRTRITVEIQVCVTTETVATRKLSMQ